MAIVPLVPPQLNNKEHPWHKKENHYHLPRECISKKHLYCMDDRVPTNEDIEFTEYVVSTDGTYYDFTDWSSLTTNVDGTGGSPITAGNLVGAALDKAHMEGLKASIYLERNGFSSTPLSAPGRHTATGLSANRATAGSSGGLQYLVSNGTTTRFNTSIPPAAAQYAVIGLSIFEDSNTFARVFCNLTSNLALLRDGLTAAYSTGTASFGTPENTILINSVASVAFTYEVAHVVEIARGSTAPATNVDGLFFGASRFVHANMFAMVFLGEVPTGTNLTMVRNWIAGRAGITL